MRLPMFREDAFNPILSLTSWKLLKDSSLMKLVHPSYHKFKL